MAPDDEDEGAVGGDDAAEGPLTYNPDSLVPGRSAYDFEVYQVRRPLAEPLHGSRFPIVVRFAFQIAGGVLAFVVIAAAAAILSGLIHLLGPFGVPNIVMIGLQGMELLLFSIDILCMTIFVVVEAITFIRAMVDVLRGDK